MTGWRGRARRFRFGLETLLGRRRGWFIPYRYAADLPHPGERPPYPAAERLLEAARPRLLAVLDEIEGHGAALLAIGGEPAPAPRWRQSWFPRLDAAAAYALVRRHCPRRIVEVGSGHSTRFLARAVADGGLDCRISAIDPAPRAALAGLDVALLRHGVHAADPALFADLGPSDMLAIDSSHVLMPGSDVDLLFGRVLPDLAPGTLVHVHDVFLPDDYPSDWDWRGYNEQQGVLALLQGGGFEVLWSSRYVATRMADALAGSVVARLPLPDEPCFETSLWLRKL